MPKEVQLSALAGDIDLRKQYLSEKVASEVLKLFRVSVRSTVVLTLSLVVIDAIFLGFGIIKASERLITEKVLLAIIGASLVQVGAALAAIVFALFSKPSNEAEQESP